ncbi:hypothetical protein SAMN04489722_10667 [Algibacter lectus]|uniref:hypothetical protein n=1 Tax=Algibacter lectus TaxID=221126 RepID=UPI0008F2C03D|nr:hypothetical protein [Algibacter lectus]SFD20801.1 hypothetical protein SAMN04489722_10667 [Algibacter lectus]
MKNILENTTYGPIGLSELEALRLELYKINTIKSDHPFSLAMINNLILKIDFIIKKLTYNPRLPLHQIEKDIVEICKADVSINGVVVNILFTKKYKEIDSSRLGCLTVNV